jgi:1-acyl-sn-glycerol-3-phosphate acyltransferase
MNPIPWEYDTLPDLDQSMVERLRTFPREPDMLVYGARLVSAMILRGGLRLYHRLQIEGKDRLPRDGSFVLVSNHASHLDTLCLIAALPIPKIHRAFPAAAQDYFFVNAPRTMIAAVIVNAMPFNRQCNPRQSITLCKTLLQNSGNILIIFPEGTRSLDGELGDFKPGIGLFLAGTNIPAVPCYLDGAHQCWPKGKLFPRPRKLRLTIGEPREFGSLKPGKDSALQISRELREAVIALRHGMR